jgi:hypothetical protein
VTLWRNDYFLFEHYKATTERRTVVVLRKTTTTTRSLLNRFVRPRLGGVVVVEGPLESTLMTSRESRESRTSMYTAAIVLVVNDNALYAGKTKKSTPRKPSNDQLMVDLFDIKSEVGIRARICGIQEFQLYSRNKTFKVTRSVSSSRSF